MSDLSQRKTSGTQPTAYQRLVRIAMVLGIVGFLGGGLWLVAGGGIFGSPVEGAFAVDKSTGVPNHYWQYWIIWVVLAGPMALLPYALLEKFFPRVGAVAMIIAAIAVAEFGIRSGRNYWGYAGGDALIVIGCLAAPMLLQGVALLAPRRRWPAVKITSLALAVFVVGACVRFQMEKDYWNAQCPAKAQGR